MSKFSGWRRDNAEDPSRHHDDNVHGTPRTSVRPLVLSQHSEFKLRHDKIWKRSRQQKSVFKIFSFFFTVVFKLCNYQKKAKQFQFSVAATSLKKTMKLFGFGIKKQSEIRTRRSCDVLNMDSCQ